MTDLAVIVFDLDGTLIKTREASWELFQRTNAEFGLGIDEPEAYFELFRHNAFEALDELSGDPARAAAVREHFLDLLRREYTPDVVPGMGDVVRTLASHYTLTVISANTMEAARRILTANDIATCFAHVYSSDVSFSKIEQIGRLLSDPSQSCGRRCSPHYDERMAPRMLSPGSVLLVTDTVGDVEAGRQVGVRVVGVSWGMHSAEDLERAGAELVCIWPEELLAYLLPGGACASGACAFVGPGSPTSHAEPRVAPVPAPAPVPAGATARSEVATSDLRSRLRRAASTRADRRRRPARPAASAAPAVPRAAPACTSELREAISRIVPGPAAERSLSSPAGQG